MTAPARECQPEATPLRQDMPLPWIVGPFGDIWVAADVEIIEGKWRETCPEPRIVVTTGGLDTDPKLAAQIVEAVNSHATLQARVDELTKALEWRPIETAPKNRLLLVGFSNSAGKWRSMHAQYRDDLPQHDDAADDDEPAESGWYEGSLEAEMLFPVRPTHWQPLPAAPSVPLEDR